MARMLRHRVLRSFFLLLFTCGLLAAKFGSLASAEETAAERGYHLLRSKVYLPTDIQESEFTDLWEVWPEPLRSEAEAATPEERREMAFSRYGLIKDPANPDGVPLGYVSDGNGGWVTSCLQCHGGKVAGRVIPGLGNTHFAFQTFAEDAFKLRVSKGQKLTQRELTAVAIPLGRSNGTTNAQVFSEAFIALRDEQLEVVSLPRLPPLVHHDLDPPPLWLAKKKSRLYIDGFVEKTHRVIMQFVLSPENEGETVRGWEDDFQDIMAWIESLEAPSYPWEIDESLAAKGRVLFEKNCAECHGTYGENETYPERRVAIEEIGTDPVRLRGMPEQHREFFSRGWMSEDGKRDVVAEPDGYVAPPLDGIWSSAPYLHNGSVPTLWHLMHADQRPTVWLRSEDGYDRERVGLEVMEFESLPAGTSRGDERRRYYDTRLKSKTATGHEYPEVLSEAEKQAVLEYLKTL